MEKAAIEIAKDTVKHWSDEAEDFKKYNDPEIISRFLTMRFLATERTPKPS